MRVLAFCDYYDRASIGGAERVAREVYERLVVDHGVELTVVGALPERRGRQAISQSDARQPSVVEDLVGGYDLSRVLGAQLTVSPALRRAAEADFRRARPDVIHINGLHFHSSAVGLGVARRHRIPVVTTTHLADVTAMPGRIRQASILFDRFAGKRIMAASARVVAVSQAAAEHAVALGADPEHVSVALNGVDRKRFTRRDHGPRTTQLRVALVGRLIANKGHRLALEAIADARRRGRDVTLTIIGDGPLEPEARRQVAELGLGTSVHFVGRVTDVAERLAHVDVLLRPSYTEGLPLAVLEALAAGVPVICTDVPGNAEAVRDGIDGFVVPIGDVIALADAMVRVADDRELLEQLAVAAEKGADRFNWDTCAAAHLEAMYAAVDQCRSPAVTG